MFVDYALRTGYGVVFHCCSVREEQLLSSVSFVFLFTYENSDETGLNYSFCTSMDDIKSTSVIMFKLLPRGVFKVNFLIYFIK
jgi:hypothetical protein